MAKLSRTSCETDETLHQASIIECLNQVSLVCLARCIYEAASGSAES
jgi:hypothetical protein